MKLPLLLLLVIVMALILETAAWFPIFEKAAPKKVTKKTTNKPTAKPKGCEPERCPKGTTHAACTNTKGFSKNCGQQMTHTFIQVDGALREKILQHVNVMRNSVASGLFNLSAAARMPTMAWDNDLTASARSLIHLCDHKGKLCSNTAKYNYVATIELTGTTLEHHNNHLTEDILGVFLPLWFNDVFSCHTRGDGQIVPNGQGGCVGHYIPLIQDRGNRMGCAIRSSKHKETNSTMLTLICNLSRASVNNMPPYTVGLIPGEDCKSGRNNLYIFLCDPEEEVDNNYVEPVKEPESSCEERLKKLIASKIK